MKIIKLIKIGSLLVSKHKSAIMSGGAIVTGLAGVIFAVKATIKSVKDVEKATEEKQQKVENENRSESNDTDSENSQVKNEKVKLTKIEVIKITWKHFIPVFIMTATTTTFIICAHHVDAKRIAAAASALALSEKMNKELQNKTIEEFGKEKAVEIQQAILKKNPDLAKAYDSGFIQKTNTTLTKANGTTYESFPVNSYRSHCWFRDEISGREFWSTRNNVEYAANKAIRDAINGCCPVLSLNTWYQWLDLEPSKMGDKLGWDLDRGQTLDITFEPDMTDTGDPCLIIRYCDDPRVI